MGLAVAEYSYQHTSIFTARKITIFCDAHSFLVVPFHLRLAAQKMGARSRAMSQAMGRASGRRLSLCPLPPLGDVLWQDVLGSMTWAFLQSDPDCVFIGDLWELGKHCTKPVGSEMLSDRYRPSSVAEEVVLSERRLQEDFIK